jgi:Osmosensitive K+ channel histidine kinase
MTEDREAFSAVEAITEVISQSESLGQILRFAVAKLSQVLPADCCWIQLVGETKGELTLAVQQGFTPEMTQETAQLKLGQSLTGEVALHGKAITTADIATDPRYTLRTPSQAGLHSFCAIPLSSEKKIVGVLGIASSAKSEFRSEDISLLNTVGHQLGTALGRAGLYKGAREQLVLVNKLGRITSSSLDIQEVYEGFADELRKLMNVDWATIAFIVGDKLRFVALSTRIGSAWERREVFPLSGTAIEWVAQHKQALIESDLAQERKFCTGEQHIKQGVRSIMYLPLITKDEVFACLIIASRRPNAYGQRELALLEQVSAQISGAIDNARLYQLERKQHLELEEQAEIRSQFITALSHELQTPLTSMLASGGLLAEQVQKEQPHTPMLTLAQNILAGCHNLEAKLAELFDLAKGELGTLKLELEPLDPLLLLQNVTSQLSPVIQSKGQSFTLDIPPSLPWIKADGERLGQVLTNLLSNATKFTPKGGDIALKARKRDNDLLIQVQDNGVGISKEEQKRLFEPYYRARSSKSERRGLGLGLTLCKQLVELHGGKIWVESEAGKGSTFSFSLSLSRQ